MNDVRWKNAENDQLLPKNMWRGQEEGEPPPEGMFSGTWHRHVREFMPLAGAWMDENNKVHPEKFIFCPICGCVPTELIGESANTPPTCKPQKISIGTVIKDLEWFLEWDCGDSQLGDWVRIAIRDLKILQGENE